MILGSGIAKEEVKQTLLKIAEEFIQFVEEFATKLGQKGIKVGEREDSRWRLVTHYGITSDDIDYSLEVINNVFS